jgi:hypothetical protein
MDASQSQSACCAACERAYAFREQRLLELGVYVLFVVMAVVQIFVVRPMGRFQE